MKEFGIKSSHAGFWSSEEEDVLAQNYRSSSKDELIRLLPGRTWQAIKLKAMDLGLSTPLEEHRCSQEVRQILKENSEKRRVDVDFSKTAEISYVMGVIDGDGFHDQKGTIGLEVVSKHFADKFVSHLESIGLNPGRGQRRGQETVWASSSSFVKWLKELDFNSKFEWLKNKGDRWDYLEGAYDSDGNFSQPGPRICSYNEEEKKFLHKLLVSLGLDATIQQNNAYVRASSRDEFFQNIDTVYDNRRPDE